MAGEFVRGKQLAAAEITNRELAVGALTADATGRAIIASGFFDSATVTNLFAAGAISDAILATPYIKADGTRAFTGAQSMGGFQLNSLATPTAATDAANKAYVDSVAAGLDPKTSCRLATATALPTNTYSNGTAGVGATLTATVNAALSVDGTAVAVGDRVLVKNEAAPANNGIYVVTATGSGAAAYVLTRSTDFNSTTTAPVNIVPGAFTFVAQGSVNAASGWILTTQNPITVGTTSLTFAQFSASSSYTWGNGLAQTGSTINIVSAAGTLTLTVGNVEVTYGTVASPLSSDAAAAVNGVANSASRSDHKHVVSTAAPATTALSDASTASQGTATSLLRSDARLIVSTAVPGTAADAVAATQGTSTSLLRADAKLQVSTGTPTVTVKTDASAAATGTAATLLRTDTQLLLSTAAPTVTVKSDASAASQGTATSSVRSDAQFVAATAAPTAAHVLSDAGAVAQGVSSSLMRADATMTALTAVPTVVSNATNTNAQGTSTSLARADHQHQDYYLTKEYRRIAAVVIAKSSTSARATAAGAGGDITTAKGVPSGQGFAIYVKINGIDYSVGDGVNTGVAFWFTNSAVSGATPLTFANVVNGSFLWVNNTQLGFALDTSDFYDILFDSATI